MCSLVLDLCSSTSSCALFVLVLSLEPLIGGPTAEPRRSNARSQMDHPVRCVCVLTTVLGAQEQQRCSSRVVPLFGVRGMSNLVKISREFRCTKPLWARSSDFFVHVLSRKDRRNFCRSTRRSRSGKFLPLGISIRNSQCASCRPSSLLRCACRTPFHRFRSACSSHRGSRRIGGTAEGKAP